MRGVTGKVGVSFHLVSFTPCCGPGSWRFFPMKFSRLLVSSLLLACGAGAFAQSKPGEIPPHPPRLPDGIPAFPGAWGGGMFTTGGRGGRVLAVTNLNDAGPGSLRAAVEAQGARIVVFRVAGTIYLETNLNINHPDITIAGQSAPGDGICIAHQSLNINTHNVIVRHLRARRGKPEGGQGSDNIGGNPVGQIVIDHCSTSWGMDENLSLYRYMDPQPDGSAIKRGVKNLTIQWSISSEALNAKNHAFGGTWGGEDSTFHHNLFASNTARNPSIGMSGEFDFRNNVIFNWGHRTMDGGDETSMVNVINNYYKAGPAARGDIATTFARIDQRSMYSPGSALAAGNWYPKEKNRPGKWYVAGNVLHGNAEITADNWKGMRATDGKTTPELLERARERTPFEGWPVAQQTAEQAFESVLAKAGATLPKRDVVDTRVTEMVRTGNVGAGNGIVRDPKDVGGFPELKFDPAEVPADTDGDGMPDAWETKHGFDAKKAADGALDADGDGYTNVEEFLNGTNPREKIDYRNLANNVDTIS